MALFNAAMKGSQLLMCASPKIVGTIYRFELRYLAALTAENCYSLRVELSWADGPATHQDYCRRTAPSWFGFWTRDLQPASPPAADDGSDARYREQCEAALRAEAHLDSAEAIQASIVSAMKRGGTFSTSHKEGGTKIRWRHGRFIRSDYGDDPGEKVYWTKAGFLSFLRQFYDSEVNRASHPDKIPELDAWRLISRLLREK